MHFLAAQVTRLLSLLKSQLLNRTDYTLQVEKALQVGWCNNMQLGIGA
jgi:hypothetical protein